MDRLMYVIVFTPEIERMKAFYRDGMGLEVASETPYFVSFGTGGASLALMALSPNQKREFELCFQTADVDADVKRLRSRGVTFIDEVKWLPFGRVIHARDPESNLLSLLQPSAPAAPGSGTALTTVVLNCRDLTAAKTWYRDRLGLMMNIDSPWWVEFDGGETHVALHPLVDHGVLETHHADPVTIGFASGDLDEWVEELRLNGVEFAAEITDRGFGRFAEILDPDGNALVLRDSPAPPTLEEKLAEDFDDEDEPRHVAIRRGASKNLKAVSRLSVRPEYHSEKNMGPRPQNSTAPALAVAGVKKLEPESGRAPVPATEPRRAASAPSVRGGGPNRTRLKPRKSRDPERIRTLPASGHQKQAAGRSLETQKRAAATVSRTKPAKRAGATKSDKARAGTKSRRGTGRG
jgi:catechol 2,3-dioxygenase-like lactoylglutathione lyase family enzyme